MSSSAIVGAFPVNRGNLSAVNYNQRQNTGPQVDGTPSASTDTWQPRDADLTALAALTGTGFAARTGTDTWALRSLTLSAEADAVLALTNPAGIGGNPLFDLDTQSANRVFAGPATGAAAKPAFRALVAADIPDLSSSYDVAGAAASALSSAESYTDSAVSALSSVYQPLDADLTALAGLTGTDVFAVRTGAGAWSGVDYVSGTFTPTVTFATPGDVSVAYTQQIGSYFRVGNAITFAVQLVFAATYTTASGNFRVAGLPVAASATAPNARLLAAWVTGTTPTWPAGTTYLSGASQQSQSYFQIVGYGSAIGAANFGTAQIVSGTTYTLVVAGTYYV